MGSSRDFFFFFRDEFFETDPVNAVNRAGVDRLVDDHCRVTILADCPTFTCFLNHQECVRRDMGAIAATNTDFFVDPDCLHSQLATKTGLQPGRSRDGMGGCSESG